MGTRADFYVGLGQSAEWLGSLAFDGDRIFDATKKHAKQNPDSAACWAIKTATDEDSFRKAVAELLALNDDATTPEQGWPWPWSDSCTTDYAYAFANGACKVFSWGRPIENDDAPKLCWPDMSDRANVTFGHRSGLLIIGG